MKVFSYVVFWGLKSFKVEENYEKSQDSVQGTFQKLCHNFKKLINFQSLKKTPYCVPKEIFEKWDRLKSSENELD